MSTTQTQSDTTSIVGPVVATTAVTVISLLWAFFVNSPWKSRPADWGIDPGAGLVDILWLAAFTALGVGVIYGVVARRALAGTPQRAARVGLILAVVAIPLSVIAFWTGVPIVMGSAAAFLGFDARKRLGEATASSTAAIVLGLLVAAASVFLCITG